MTTGLEFPKCGCAVVSSCCHRLAALTARAEAAERLIADVLEERADELDKAACDRCENCGELVMCDFHSLLSALQRHVGTCADVERASLRSRAEAAERERDGFRRQLEQMQPLIDVLAVRGDKRAEINLLTELTERVQEFERESGRIERVARMVGEAADLQTAELIQARRERDEVLRRVKELEADVDEWRESVEHLESRGAIEVRPGLYRAERSTSIFAAKERQSPAVGEASKEDVGHTSAERKSKG